MWTKNQFHRFSLLLIVKDSSQGSIDHEISEETGNAIAGIVSGAVAVMLLIN